MVYLYYYPQVRIILLGGESAADNKSAAVINTNVSNVRFFSKHYGIVIQLLFGSIWLFALIMRMPSVLRLASSERYEKTKAYLGSSAALFQPLTINGGKTGN